MIPAQAVEAALTANRAYKSQRSMDNAEKQMRAVLEAAAPHMHCTITTAEQLDALPIGSVILGYDDDLDQLVSRKSVDDCWEQAGIHDGWQSDGIIQWYGSVTVLHEPTP